MSSKYYMIVGGEQTGPYSLEDLKYAGLKPDSHVWREGLDNWVVASSLPELAHLFNPPSQDAYHEQPQYGPQHHGPQGYGPQGGYGARRGPYDNPQGYGQQPSYGNQAYGQPQFGPGYNPNMTNLPHQNWMTWAIVATVLGFLCSCIGMIFGIVAIVKANNANKYYAMGDRNMGDYCNSGARTWTIVAFVVAGIGLLFNIFYLNSFRALYNF